MSANTTIEWASKSWNPIRGCSRVSPGCDSCYAMKFAHRFSGDGKPYEGLTVLRPKTAKRPGVDWSGVARFIPEALDEPLRWKKPERIFVNSMSDLFHHSLTNEQIATVFRVMALAEQHQFLVLTKRIDRALKWFEWSACQQGAEGTFHPRATLHMAAARNGLPFNVGKGEFWPGPWPLPNVWLGVSCENQETADERWSLLSQLPAAVHWLSMEPLLGPVTMRHWATLPGWVVVGGESGPGARPYDVAWPRSIIAQCRTAGVPVFHKQFGGNVFAPWKVEWSERLDGSLDAFCSDGVGTRGTNFATVWPNGVWHTWDANGTGGENASEHTVELAKSAAIEALQRQHVRPIKGWARHRHMLRHRKGADMSEWPEDLRVREFPQVRTA